MLTFFVIIALALSVAVQSTNAVYNNTIDNLSKRSNLTYDSAIDYEKIARGLTRRAGSSGILDKLKQKVKGKNKIVEVKLHLNKNNLWVTHVILGEAHPVLRRVTVDTGTSLFWADYRSQGQCLSNFLSTHLSRGGETRPVIHGHVHLDKIDLGGAKGTVRVIAADEVLHPETTFDADGELGLGLSKHGYASSFIASFLPQIASTKICFYLALDHGMMHIGGKHKEYYTGQIEYHPIAIVSPGGGEQLWGIAAARISVNGLADVVTDAVTVLDTGTMQVYGPPDQVEDIYRHIRGADPLQGRYDVFHCQRPHNIGIRWKQGKERRIEPEHFSLGPIDLTGEYCEGVFKKDIFSGGRFRLGWRFMINVYTVLKLGENPRESKVGFGDLPQAPAYRPPRTTRT